MMGSPAGRLLFLSSLLVAIVVVLVVSGYLLLWPIWQEYRMKPARTVQPDRLPLGTVRVGATVEASARVFTDLKHPVVLKATVREPHFVKVRSVYVGAPSEGSSGGTVFCDVFISIDTSKSGDYSGTLKVYLGGQRGEIPVTVTVAPQEPEIPRVLIAETPFERFSTGDASLFCPLLDLVKSLKIDVSYTQHLPEQLAGFDVVLLGPSELCSLDRSKGAQLEEFVAKGGRLIIAADAFFRPSVPKANEILEGYGIEIEDKEPHREVDSQLVVPHQLTNKVRELHFFRPSPIRITDESEASILVRAPFDEERGYVAISRQKGEVLVIGQSLWWNWLGRGDDNAQLLGNLLENIRRE